MQSKATTVEAYLKSLSDDRRQTIEAVRAVILKNLDAGFQEVMQYGMIGYSVPHKLFPAGYHCDPKQPLPFAAMASQKNYCSLYLMFLYGHSPTATWFADAWKQTGKKLDMGKCCIRFKRVEDLALDLIGEVFARVTAKKYIEHYTSLLGPKGKPKSAGKPKARRAKAK